MGRIKLKVYLNELYQETQKINPYLQIYRLKELRKKDKKMFSLKCI